MSEEIIDSNISHEELTLVINEDQNYFRLKKASEQKGMSSVIMNVIDY